MTEQLDLFAIYFNPDKYEWTPMSGINAKRCYAEIYIPANLCTPLEISEKTGLRSGSEAYEEHLDKWNAHMQGIAYLVPDEFRKEFNNANGWETAQKLFGKHRKNKQPIKVSIASYYVKFFLETEVVQ